MLTALTNDHGTKAFGAWIPVVLDLQIAEGQLPPRLRAAIAAGSWAAESGVAARAQDW